MSAHMLMRKSSNFHCTLTSIRLIFLLQETDGNVLNTDDFFRCPHGTQELFNVLTEHDVGTVPHNFQQGICPRSRRIWTVIVEE